MESSVRERIVYGALGGTIGFLVGAGLAVLIDPQSAAVADAKKKIAELEAAAESRNAALPAPVIAEAVSPTVEPAEVEQPAPAPVVEPAQPTPAMVWASALYRAYQANEVAADAQYADRLVRIKGRVETIGKDIIDTPYVALWGGEGSFFGVQCMFDSTAGLASLRKGDTVIIQGRISGLMANVIVREAELVQ